MDEQASTRWVELPGKVWQRVDGRQGRTLTVTLLYGQWHWLILDGQGDPLASGVEVTTVDAQAEVDEAVNRYGQ